MTPHTRTTTKGSEGAPDGDGAVTEAPVFSETPGLRPGPVAPAGSFGRAAWGRVATGSVTAAGVDSSRRDWIVPVPRLASSATSQRGAEAAGSRRRCRVTHAALHSGNAQW